MTQESISVGQLVFRLAGRKMIVTTPTNQCTLDQEQSRQLAMFFTQYDEHFTRGQVIEAATGQEIITQENHISNPMARELMAI